MTTLVLLLFLTGTLLYQTIDIQKDQVLNEMKASSVDLKSSTVENAVETSLPIVFNKVLNDAELRVINKYNSGETDPFFNSTDEVLLFLETNVSKMVNNYLKNVSKEYGKSGYNLTYDFNITNISMVDGFTFKVGYLFNYTLSKDGVFKSKSINSYQYCTVKTVIDAYHYVKSSGRGFITIYNPNNYSLTDFQVKIILDNSNYDFSSDPDGIGLGFYDENNNTIPYWIEYWDNVANKAIVWIKVPNIDANGNAVVKIVSTYYSTSSNGDLVFELFDDFEDKNSINYKWNYTSISSGWNYGEVDSPLYNELYNKQMIQYEKAPPVARMISQDNTNLDSYIIEVDAKGYSTSYNTPNIMVGYFANKSYFNDDRHPDEFYTLELGGRVDGNRAALKFIPNGDLIWLAYDNYFDNLQISHEYPENGSAGKSNILDIHRARLEINANEVPRILTWYRVKIQIVNNRMVSGKYYTIDDYLNNNEPDWMINYNVPDTHGNYFELGTSAGFNSPGQDIYFDNFRVRKYAEKEPIVITDKKLIYISPPRDYSTHYGEIGDISYNPYFVEDNSSPSIIDMLAGKNENTWGYGIRIN